MTRILNVLRRLYRTFSQSHTDFIFKTRCCDECEDCENVRLQQSTHSCCYGFTQRSDIKNIRDKVYMQKLQVCIKENYDKLVKKRIHDREAEEMEREKRLILDGKMAAEDAMTELSDHPVFKISQLARRILNERKLKADAKTIKKPQNFLKNDDFLNNLYNQCEFDTKSEMEVVVAIDTAEQNRADHLLEIEEDIESGVIITQTDSDRLKYEHPLVKELRKTETVDKMYTLADSILGSIIKNTNSS